MVPFHFLYNILHLVVWQCLLGEDLTRQTDCSDFWSPLVKWFRIHIDRNHIRPFAEKSFIRATDMHVGFKVQLVVEFFIYPLCLGRSQIQKLPKHLSRCIWRCPFHCPGRQYCLSASSLWPISRRQQQILLFCACVLRSEKSVWHLGCTSSLCGSKMRFKNCSGFSTTMGGGSVVESKLNLNRTAERGAAVVWIGVTHVVGHYVRFWGWDWR